MACRSCAGACSAGQQSGPLPEYIRPGRFLATLHAMEAQFLEAERTGAGPAAGQDAAQRWRIMQRLSDIHLQTVSVLDRIQRGELLPAVTDV